MKRILALICVMACFHAKAANPTLAGQNVFTAPQRITDSASPSTNLLTGTNILIWDGGDDRMNLDTSRLRLNGSDNQSSYAQGGISLTNSSSGNRTIITPDGSTFGGAVSMTNLSLVDESTPSTNRQSGTNILIWDGGDSKMSLKQGGLNFGNGTVDNSASYAEGGISITNRVSGNRTTITPDASTFGGIVTVTNITSPSGDTQPITADTNAVMVQLIQDLIDNGVITPRFFWSGTNFIHYGSGVYITNGAMWGGDINTPGNLFATNMAGTNSFDFNSGSFKSTPNISATPTTFTVYPGTKSAAEVSDNTVVNYNNETGTVAASSRFNGDLGGVYHTNYQNSVAYYQDSDGIFHSSGGFGGDGSHLTNVQGDSLTQPQNEYSGTSLIPIMAFSNGVPYTLPLNPLPASWLDSRIITNIVPSGANLILSANGTNYTILGTHSP